MARANGDTAKLPKWAQSYIQQLERERDHARARLADIPVDETDTIADPYATPPRGLTPGSTVMFALGKRYGDGHPADYIQARIEEDHRGVKQVLIHASDQVRVLPQSSNALRLEVGR